MSRSERLLRALVLTSWTLLFLWLLAPTGRSRHLAGFLNPDLWWLVGCGFLCSLIALLLLIRQRHGLHPRNPSGLDILLLLLRSAILLLPLFYFPLAARSQFTTSDYAKRSVISANSPSISASPTKIQPVRQGAIPAATTEASDAKAVEPPPHGIAFRQTTLVELLIDPHAYLNKPVQLIGMVAHEKLLRPNQRICYRFMMSCCAADSQPLGVIVEHEGVAGLPEGSWIEVRGIVREGHIGKSPVPRLDVSDLKQIKQPEIPYMYPPF